MRKLSLKSLSAVLTVAFVSVVASVTTFAQSYRYDYDYVAGDAAAATVFGGLSLVYALCVCCIPLILASVCAYIVYSDSKKINVENGVLWAVLSFIFPLIGILIYFLAIKPDAVKNQGVTSTPVAPVQTPEEKKE